MSIQIKRYRPDLKTFMALCASNYAKMCKLIPETKIAIPDSFHKSLSIALQPELNIKLLQASRYTQTFQLQQTSKNIHMNRDFCVRLYHDAQMAEILSGVNDSMLPPIYKIPNSEMKQVDEKLQLNRFLSEWLSYCIENANSEVNYKTQLAFLS